MRLSIKKNISHEYSSYTDDINLMADVSGCHKLETITYFPLYSPYYDFVLSKIHDS